MGVPSRALHKSSGGGPQNRKLSMSMASVTSQITSLVLTSLLSARHKCTNVRYFCLAILHCKVNMFVAKLQCPSGQPYSNI